MKDTEVIILAAGAARRFGGMRKQLLPIGATTILERIINQSKEHCCCPTVAAYDNEIVMAAIRYGARVYRPEEREVTCDTILSTWELWKDRTIILLGDVVYSDDVMNKIFEYDGDFTVFGNTWEIFAMSFTRNNFGIVSASLKAASKYKMGKIRYMYKNYVGLEMDSEEIEGSPPGDNFIYVKDWTGDVDLYDEYINIMNEVVEKGLLDV
jgi:choline kinase